MKTIYKYTLKDTVNNIELPIGAKVISAKNQREQIYIWVVVNTHVVDMEVRTFEVCGTGTRIQSKGELKFIDTVLMTEGAFVFHIFEILN